MIKNTGVPFDAKEFVEGLHEIGKQSNKVIGYLVDGQFVTVGRLEHFLKTYGGESLELLLV